MSDKTLEFLNVGITVTPPTMGAVTFKTLCVEDLQVLAIELIDFIVLMQSDLKEDSTSIDMIRILMSKPESLISVKKILATACGKQIKDFDRKIPQDYLMCINTFLKVNDFKELKSLFFEILKSVGIEEKTDPALEPNKDSKM